MTIKIFLSSSLKLKDERNAFIEAFKAEEDSDTKFKVYAHEKNGEMCIISGADSQEAINAAALDYDAFITYAGDRIGNATIDELLHELNSAKSLFKFIYVLHQPGLLTEAMKGPGYTDWDVFYRRHMHDGKIKYYETELDGLTVPVEQPKERREECLRNIRDKAAAIARELRSKTIPELYPAMLSYSKVISTGQSNYRKALDFYFRRSVDDSIREALASENPAALTIVSGTSLAGKTRAVTEALKTMPPDTHIHILQFDEHTGRNLAGIRPELQFRRDFRNVLFVDDLHSILDTDPDAPRLFMELCRFAAADPRRLRIIATSILSADDTLAPLRPLSTGDGWLRHCTIIEIGAMKRSEAKLMVRQLRRKGKLDSLGIIKAGAADIPLGALFVDLDRMHNYYDDAMRRDFRMCLIFDAVKTLRLWKNKNRGDIGTLLEFINGAYTDETDETLTRGELIDMLRLIPEFVLLTGGLRPRMVIEDILVNDVFRFEISKSIDRAIARITSYIAGHEKPIKAFTKLANRLEYAGHISQADTVVDNACRLFPVETLPGYTEAEVSMGDQPLDWVRPWRGAVARSLARRNDMASLYAMLPEEPATADRSYHFVLATVIADESRRSGASPTLTRLLDGDGMPRQQFLATSVLPLLTEFIDNLPFDKALRCFAETDFHMMSRNSTPTYSEDNFTEQKAVTFLRTALNAILVRVESTEQAECVFKALEIQNARLPEPAYSCDAEALFHLVYSSTWYSISRNIPGANIPLLFNRILAVDIPDTHPDKTTLTTVKAMCLNAIIGAMNEYDARTAWKAMGELRDNFTLTTVLRQMPDFAVAKGFVDEYLESESGHDATVNIAVLNALLDSCRTSSDIQECRGLFVKYGLLPPDGKLEDINDEYTQGILLKSGSMAYDNMLKLLERYKDTSRVRNIRTLGNIVYAAPDYTAARHVLYDADVSAVTAEEQESMRSSALILSWLIGKADSPEEAADAWGIINDVLRREKNGECLEPILCHPDTNMLPTIVKSRILCPSTTDAADFLKRVEAEFPDLPYNPVPRCNIAERMLFDEYPEPSESTIAFLNRLILDNQQAKIEIRRRFVKNRFYCRASVPRNSPFPNRRGIYPMLGADGQMVLQETESLDFATNMLKHGWLHPFMLSDLVKHIIDHALDPDQELSQVIAYAKKWKIYVDQKAYINLREMIKRRGLKTDLLPLARDYSIIKELTLRLHDNHPGAQPISVSAAFAMIRDYERRMGCRLYLSQRFMDAVVKGLTKERGAYFDRVMDSISELLPDYFMYNDYVVYFLAHLIRHPSNFARLRKLMPPGPIHQECYQALVAAMSKSTEANRQDLAGITLRELETSLAAGICVNSSYILGILNYTRRFNLRQAVDYLKAHNMEIRGNGYDIHQLMQFVRTRADYEYVLTFTKDEIDQYIKVAILTGLVYAMYDTESRTVRADVLDAFNDNATVREWHALAACDSKGSLLSSVKNIYQQIEDPDTPEAQDFFDFWEDVGGFRL